MKMSELREAAFAQLVRARARQEELQLFALVGGARDARIVPLLEEHAYVKTACLYSGKLSPKLRAAAPWLADLREGEGALCDELLDQGWGRAWGIYLVSSASLGQLRKHFRRFLQVYREDGGKLYFRFHDPRVLRAYLPTCNREELDFVFGPISELLCEGEDPLTLLRYSLDEEEGLSKELVRLDGDPAPQSEEAGAPPAGALVQRLGLDPAGAPEELPQIRAALRAEPGQPELLELLARIAQRSFPQACEDAAGQVELLAQVARDEGGPAALEAACDGLAGGGSARAVLASLAPELQGRLSGAARERLRGAAQALVDLDDFAEAIQDLRGRLRKTASDGEEEQRTIQAAFRFLEEAGRSAEAWRVSDELTEKTQGWLKRVERRLEKHEEASGSQVSAALMSLLVGMGVRSRGEAAKVAARTARGLLAALEGTRASDAAPSAPPPTSPPQPSRRRYTARRRALSDPPARLVIRDEQFAALDEAVRRGLAVRLFVHAREEHPQALEDLGAERVREIVDLCLEKSLDYEIQKFSAQKTLLDLMLRIDPEFTELEEYAWAKELLESDMIEPNGKPQTIVDQL